MIYYVSGDDSYSRNRYINEISEGKEQITIDMQKIEFSGLMTTLLTIDLFATPRIYLLENFKGFTIKSEKFSKANLAILKQIFTSDNELVVIADKGINRSTVCYAQFGEGIAVNHFPMQELDFDSAIESYVTKNQIIIEEAALELLKNNFPNNIFGATNDLAKIWEYTNHNSINIEDVKTAGQMLAEHKIFELYNLIVMGKNINAVNYLEILRGEGITDSDILLACTSQIKRMYESKLLFRKGLNDFKIAEIIGISPFAIKQNRRVLTHVSEKRLEMFVKVLSDFDYQFKSGQNTPTNLVNLLIMK